LPYCRVITKLREKAVETVRRLPSDGQDEIAQAMLQLASSDLDREQIDLAAGLKGLEEVRRGYISTDAQIKSAFRRFET
jgi:hypothetical protein